MQKLLKNKMRFFTLLFFFGILLLLNFTYFRTYSDRIIDFAQDPDYVESGIVGSTVYVNDLDSDYYYYLGLNYTSNDGTIPTKENKNIYNDSNLVQVKITYNAQDENGNNAYVSSSERQNKFIYFKTLSINDNGTSDKTDDYIDLLLIDNPFTFRPSDKAFNGWVTSFSSANISYDSNYYERWAKIPIEYENDKPKKIDITFTASWTKATSYFTNGSVNSIISNIKRRTMEKLDTIITTYDEYNMYGYYKKVTLSNGDSLNGYYDYSGNSFSRWSSCSYWSNAWNGNGCDVYKKITTYENYSNEYEYYRLDYNMVRVYPEDLGINETVTVNPEYQNKNMSPYYEMTHVNYNESQDGFYDVSGNKLSGTCNTYDGCTLFKLIQYYDENGNQNIFDENKDYYYLVTRDTNIVVLNQSISNVNLPNNANYPYTLTGLYNGTNYNTTFTASRAINIYDDFTMENLELRYTGSISNTDKINPPSGYNNNTSGVLYARFNNVKISRTIRRNNNYFSLRSIVGGNNSSSGSNNNPTKNKLVIEAGKYSSISLTGGAATGSGNHTLYLNNKSVYGSDYDRVKQNNDNLIVTYCAAGTWGSRIYANTSSSYSNDVSIDLTVKSGSFGTGKIDLTSGIYVGGRYGGTMYAVRKVKVEGGYIYNLIGGPISDSSRENYNDIYIYMTGGNVDMITGGAGTSATYGNRILQITGGTVNYSVFGGSNGQDGSSSDGTLNGSTYLYIGGNSKIGKEDLVNNNSTLWGAEAGSVFGNGNGNTSYDSIGSCDNATIIVDEKATIYKNIYGGGNYGATGISSTKPSSLTTIVINNGLIKGSVFGGGNKNGAGNSSKNADIDISMHGGAIAGSLYGGSNIEGDIYGNVNILMTGGEISNNLFGGGKGGKTSSNNGTFVRNNINITVGSADNNYTPIINDSVFGGSEFGSVNGLTQTNTVSSDKTTVTINKGIINNVFGGGQGDSNFTPYVMGDIKVEINDGIINNVYGANDENGIPNGKIEVFINGGEIQNTYGGGNKTSAKTTNVYLQGGNSSYIFGGSNLTGTVQETNVICTSGKSNEVYGGNNEGGTADITNVTVNGGDISTVYGGGKKTSVTTKTNTNINAFVPRVFGGSNLSGNIPVTNVNLLENSKTYNTFGGNNEGGKVTTANVNIQGIYQNNVYGGGYKADTTNTYVSAFKGGINNLYGGANEANVENTNVYLGSASITNVYGGSNLSGEVNSSKIENTDYEKGNDNVLLEYSVSASSQTSNDYASSENIAVTIKNETSANITSWNLYLMTSEGVIGADWSSATIEKIEGGFLVNEKNKYYGVNSISSNGSYSFDFHVFSNVNFEDFKIKGIYFIGYDEQNNSYTSKIKINNIYGGNNDGGKVYNTNISLSKGEIDYVYGGGNKAQTINANTLINNVNITHSIFGGGNEASVDKVNLEVKNSVIADTATEGFVFGGGNKADVLNDITTKINTNSVIFGSVYGGGNLGKVNGKITFTVEDSTVSNEIYGAGNKAQVGIIENSDSVFLTLKNVNAKNIYGGANAALTLGNVNIDITGGIISESIFGGANGENSIVQGDQTGESNPAKVKGNINLKLDSVNAKNIYGGGNLGYSEKSVNVNAKNINISESIYGGANASRVKENTYLYVSGGNISGSVYAGGNGVLAIVEGNTNLDIDNNANILNHVFGGGNAAQTGTKEKNNSTGTVNIAGANIQKNVYGGANTSVLYGTAYVNIGKNKVTNNELISSDIIIGGTVFGGGEANASGSEIYDFTFISVTKGMEINIDGLNHNIFTISGSIFGSGNASSTKGFSYINIYNYGTNNNVKRNVSIQRASKVVIDNSFILLSGAKDRTNEYSDVLFTLSRLDELVLKNSSSIYLETGANLLKKFTSLTASDEKASVIIDNETGVVTKNVNNRLYMKAGKNLNIATNENVTEYGNVSGMTFFGMFELDRNKNIITALYNDFENNQSVSSGDLYYFTNGSYVLGKHLTNHNTNIDGFYSNYAKDGSLIEIKYIEPTPKDASFYMWAIGEVVASYEITLSASKYSTLGAQEIPLINHASANTTFSILGVNFSNLDENIKLVDYNEIKRVAPTDEEADTIFGLNMKSSSSGWLTNGSTSFITEGNVNVTGTKDYIRENNNNTPGFVFYLYHSKNLKTVGNMGSVTISLVAITPVDDLNNNVERINININLTKALYNTNDYEGTITPGKKYEMFPTSPTSITTKSSFSTYYSLYMEKDTNPYKEGYSRSLVSTFAYPVNTKITMIDLHDKLNPVYYYYVVSQNDYNNSLIEYNQYGEVSYKLSKFIKMGSTSLSNNYSDEINNNLYYDSQKKVADEEFIFIVDFLESNINEDILDKTLLIELRNQDDQTLISVLGIEQQTLKYNLYLSSDTYIDLNGTINKNNIYSSDSALMTITTNFEEHDNVKDTTYGDEKLGVKISIYDKNNTLLSGQDLMGLKFNYKGVSYFPNSKGETRIKISDKVANTLSYITLDTGTSQIASGNYKIVVEAFGSFDGIYYGPQSLKKIEFNVNIIDSPYGLKISTNSNFMFIDKTTGKNFIGTQNYPIKVNYTSNLDNPNIRIKLMRRKYDTIYSMEYEDVSINDYIQNPLRASSNPFEYYFIDNPPESIDYTFIMKENLISGTYKIVLNLYDNDALIGSVYDYVIIK